MTIFYVCSYGGCGSKMLCQALTKYSRSVKHVHSRKPPIELEYIGGGECYYEWFNGIKIPDDKLNDYKVIYIYRNPVKSILSRFKISKHLEHIQTDIKTTINDVVTQQKDLYGIREFYNNYTSKNKSRNYKIYCVKYEDIFKKQNELSKILNIGPLNLIKKERKYKVNDFSLKLDVIYKDVIDNMTSNDFVFIS